MKLGFYLIFLTTMVGLLLAIITAYHMPAKAVWGTLAITTVIVCAAGSLEHHNNQKEEEK